MDDDEEILVNDIEVVQMVKQSYQINSENVYQSYD